jgi:hypothetical protein
MKSSRDKGKGVLLESKTPAMQDRQSA